MNTTTRYGWIVSLRAFAALAIVLLHVISGWAVENSWGGVIGFRWLLDGVVIQVLVRWAVPVFVMISGFLLLDPNKEMPLIKIRKYVLRMAAVLLTFGYVYCLMECVAARGLTDIPMSMLLSAKNLVEGKSWAHMWYVYMLIGLYLLFPMFRIFAECADEKTYRSILAVLFFLTIIRSTLNEVTGLELPVYIPISTAYPFYFLQGQYVRQYGMKRKRAVVCLILGAAGIAVRAVFDLKNEPDDAFVAMYSAGIFSLAVNKGFLEKAAGNSIIKQISQYSFGIYLVHPFFLNLLNKGLKIFPDILPTFIGEIAFFVFALVGAYLTSLALCKIKCMRKIIL